MDPEQDLVIKLLARHARREALSEEELFVLESWCKQSEKNRLLAELLRESEVKKAEMEKDPEETDMVWAEISKGLDEMNIGVAPVVPMPTRWRYWKAAVIVLLVGAAVYFHKRTSNEEIVRTSMEVGSPVSHRAGAGMAILTLDDGSEVNLDSVGIGNLANGRGDGDGRKIAEDCLDFEGKKDDTVIIAGVSVGIGHRPYIVRMPDGTIIYVFGGMDVSMNFDRQRRHIKLLSAGKVRCEVAKDVSRPLIVHTPDSAIVDDMGTCFQVDVSGVRKETRVTLFEGAVRVIIKGESEKLDTRWQEAVVRNGRMEMRKAEDTVGLTRWSDSALLFHFKDIALRDALQQVAWWYKCDFHFKDSVPGKRLEGEMRKTPSLNDIVTNIRVGQRLFADVEKQGNTIVVSKWSGE